MISLASSMPSRVSRSRAPSRTSQPASTNGTSAAPIALPDVDAVLPADPLDIDARGQPQAGEERLLEPLVRRQARALGVDRLTAATRSM